MTSNSL